MSKFTYDASNFYLDGKPFMIRSGSIHYFRCVPEYWRDRLMKLRAAGFNTVETYTSWNLHERREGEFDFDGILDLGKFLDIAAELGLYAIVRPGPYICAECDFGGLPSWLLNYPDMHFRCMDELFLEKEERYLKKIFDIIRPRLITNGGNILMTQVENEYGSFGNDHNYMRHLADFYRKNGIDTVLFTSDGSVHKWMLGGGSIPGVLETANFGSDPERNFRLLKDFRPDEPRMCSEFWEGWFDFWYDKHNVRTPDDVAELYEEIVKNGDNVNFYMFYGGTNFGFFNGANYFGEYKPQVTSYDYDAMITESGDLTDRFYKIRAVSEKYFGALPKLDVKNTEKKAYGKIELTESAPLFENLDDLAEKKTAAHPLTMEKLGADFGYTHYRTYIDYPTEKVPLVIDPLRDRAIIYIDGKFAGIKERDRRNDEITIDVGDNERVRIDILVENMGRINYGENMPDGRRGLVKPARIGQQFIFGYEMWPLKMDDLSALRFGKVKTGTVPAFLRGNLNIDSDPCDTFLRLDGFGKGFVKVNGFNIGRYYNTAGPQKTLYVPAPLLKKGDNEIIVFESDGFTKDYITSEAAPDLG